MQDDFALIEAWNSGDKTAAGVLFDRHFDVVYRFFKTKVDVQDVDDLVQKTFLGLISGTANFEGRSKVLTYLLAIARNQLHLYWRARSRQPTLSFLRSSLADLSPSPLSAVTKHREDRTLLEALRRIPVDMQIAIELHYWEGMRGPELARILEIPEGTVRSRLRRGLEALREQLARLIDEGARLASTSEDLDLWAAALRDRTIPLKDAI